MGQARCRAVSRILDYRDEGQPDQEVNSSCVMPRTCTHNFFRTSRDVRLSTSVSPSHLHVIHHCTTISIGSIFYDVCCMHLLRGDVVSLPNDLFKNLSAQSFSMIACRSG